MLDIEHIENLIEEKEFKKVQVILEDLDKVEIVDLLGQLGDRDDILVFKLLSKDMAAAVFSKLEPDQQEAIIRGSTDAEVAKILDSMFIDDVVYVVEEMPANAVTKILKNTGKEDREIINQILRYPEDSAGSLMTTEYVSLEEDMSVREALAYINEIGRDVVSVYMTYVIDHTKKLLGYAPLRLILMADDDERIGDIMDEDVSFIHTLEDQEEALDSFKKYNHTIMPVVDEEMRMVGIITVDDIIDVMEEEDTEDFQKMSGIVPNEDPYVNSRPYSIAKSRIPWLIMLMLTSSISGYIIGSYRGLLALYAILNSFVPMLMGTGGNAGNQSSTLIIRGMSTGEIELDDWKKVLIKELKVSLILGIVLVVVNYGKMVFLERQEPSIATIVCLSMFLTIIIANVLGSLLPMAVKRAGLDPANVASPLLTTLVDIVSLLIYFNIATAILL